MTGDSYEEEMLGYLSPKVCVQCWSVAEKSDTLLRAYSYIDIDETGRNRSSPKAEGVLVRSTPRKLIKALYDGVKPAELKERCYIGAVRYLTHKKITDVIGDAITKDRLVFTRPFNRARLQLLKRKEFRHENEARLIVVGNSNDHDERLLRVDFDPNDVFDEVIFDPRLALAERRERKAKAKGLGYEGEIGEWNLYTTPFLQVIVK